MKKLLESLDNYATSKIDAVVDSIIIRFRLDEKDKASANTVQQKFKSTYPPDQPSEHEWFKEYRVSMLHGREKAIHM